MLGGSDRLQLRTSTMPERASRFWRLNRPRRDAAGFSGFGAGKFQETYDGR
jgi:hypothetical protein